MLRRRLTQTFDPDGHGLVWRLANVALFVLALVAAAAVIVGVFYGIAWIASEGS
jgi:hypothetical protein